MKGLSSRDVTARREALTKIAAGGYPQAAGAVARLIGDPQPEIRQVAIDTLLTLLLPTQPKPTSQWERRRARRAPQTGESRARQLLIDGVQPIRRVPASAFDPLVEAMSDADSPVRAPASYAFGVLATSKLGLVPEAARTRALVSAVNMSDVKDQRAAMEALGRLRERRALQSLSERFVYHREHGPRQPAVVALEALARIGDPATANLIRPLVDSVWTRRNDTRLAVLFTRTRLFKDGSDERLHREADDQKNGAQARAYLLELGLVP